jgi:hypothetical protein
MADNRTIAQLEAAASFQMSGSRRFRVFPATTFLIGIITFDSAHR